MSAPRRSDYVAALTEIARALRQTEDGEVVAWSLALLPEQVARALEDLRIDSKKLTMEVKRLRAALEAKMETKP